MRLTLGVLACFLLLLSLAQAASPWDSSIIDVNSEIKKGEDAIAEVSITNNELGDDIYRISVDTFSFNVRSDPSSAYLSGMRSTGRDQHKTRLLFKPQAGLEPGTYQIPITIKASKEGTARTHFFFIRLRSDEPEIRDYFAAVDRILKIPSEIDPRQPIPIEINLKNRNAKNITSLTIYLKSNLFEQTINERLAPLESKVLKTEIKLNPLTPPQDGIVELQMLVDNQTVQPIIKEPFSILEYSDVVEKDAAPIGGLLSTERKKEVTNNGNSRKTHRIELKTSFIDSFFTRSDPQSYTINKEDATYLAWDIVLGPNESKTITTTTSYVPLFAVLVLGLAGVICYFVFRSPIVIEKEASVLSTKEGGIAKMKILLHVKNRTGKAFDKVVIVDKVPNLVELDKESELGTIRPTRVFQSPKEGTTLKWEIGGLERFEERLITYKINSKLTILGGINLPTAMVTFSDKKGKEQITRSNRLDVSV